MWYAQYGKMSLKECDVASSNKSRGSGQFVEVAGLLKVGGGIVVVELVVQLKVPLRH